MKKRWDYLEEHLERVRMWWKERLVEFCQYRK
jgi:hypothetical protein